MSIAAVINLSSRFDAKHEYVLFDLDIFIIIRYLCLRYWLLKGKENLTKWSLVFKRE